MPMKPSKTDLKSALAAIAKKQNTLAAWPPALRVLPIVALACAEVVESVHGAKLVNDVLGSSASSPIELAGSITKPSQDARLRALDSTATDQTSLDANSSDWLRLSLVTYTQGALAVTIPAPAEQAKVLLRASTLAGKGQICTPS